MACRIAAPLVQAVPGAKEGGLAAQPPHVLALLAALTARFHIGLASGAAASPAPSARDAAASVESDALSQLVESCASAAAGEGDDAVRARAELLASALLAPGAGAARWADAADRLTRRGSFALLEALLRRLAGATARGDALPSDWVHPTVDSAMRTAAGRADAGGLAAAAAATVLGALSGVRSRVDTSQPAAGGTRNTRFTCDARASFRPADAAAADVCDVLAAATGEAGQLDTVCAVAFSPRMMLCTVRHARPPPHVRLTRTEPDMRTRSLLPRRGQTVPLRTRAC